MNNNCCKHMQFFLSDPRYPIEYNKVFREYYIDLCSMRLNIITMDYCPWCGWKLPESLRDKFFDTLELEHNIETDIGECKDRSDIPQEFWTDEWWKKRGL